MPAQDESRGGRITGTVRFTGRSPAPRSVTVSDGTTIQHQDLVVDPKSKGLRYVVAILEDAPARPKVGGIKPAYVDQRNWVFEPRVTAVQYGQAVRFDNNDPANHSVMAISTLPANNFNQFVLPGQPLDVVFERQDRPVLIGCSLHAWMRAWVYIVPHPCFAVTDANGEFTIENVPVGSHNLTLALPDTKLKERKPIEVKPGETVRVGVDWPRLP